MFARGIPLRGNRGAGKVGDKVILEPLEKQLVDVEAWFAQLDALGARDFLPDGIPDDPPAKPDPRVFFDE
jgi:antitoxin VapB